MVILVDTSIWVNHLRSTDPLLGRLIAGRRIVQHPFVTGEVAVGALRNRAKTVWALRNLPSINAVDDEHFHTFLEMADLAGTGLGFVDVHLLAAAEREGNVQVWTRDRRMHEQADRLGLAYMAEA